MANIPVGPFTSWPTGEGGFEHFYGFIGGENNQYYPALYEGVAPVEPDKTPEEGYHLTEALPITPSTGFGCRSPWLRTSRSSSTLHPAPHMHRTHVPKEWADKYEGRFAGGWDAQLESILEQQKQRGVVPADAVLTPRPEAIPAWEDMSEEMKPVLERQMEVYAGFLEHTDFHVGRLVDAIEDSELSTTPSCTTSSETTERPQRGRSRRFQRDGQLQRTRRHRDARVHGGSERQIRYQGRIQPLLRGWAWAMCTPYQ